MPARSAVVALVAAVGLTGLGLTAAGCSQTETGASGAPPSSLAVGKPLAINRVKSRGANIVVSSPAFTDSAAIPDVYTAFGGGVSPPLMWTPVAGAKSYVVVVEDPDAPGVRPFVHWIVYDIPLTVTSLDDGAQGDATPAEARTGRTTTGQAVYVPIEPSRRDKAHRYVFEVFALDAQIQAAGAPDLNTLERAMAGHVLADGQTVGLYKAGGPTPVGDQG